MVNRNSRFQKKMAHKRGCPPRTSFAPTLVPIDLFISSLPTRRIRAAPDTRFEGRMRPGSDVRDVTMFDRVEVDVVHVRGEICVVADGVAPRIAAAAD